MPADWHTLLLALPLAAPADVLHHALHTHGWHPYDPFGAPGPAYAQRLRAFVLPLADGTPWAVARLGEAWPDDVLATLSAQHMLWAASAHDAARATLTRWDHGAPTAFALPQAAATATATAADTMPVSLLPDDVRAMARTLDGRTVDTLFGRVLGSAFGRAGVGGSAADQARAQLAASAPLPPDAPSLRALAAGLAAHDAAVPVGAPAFSDLRDAYAVAQRLARGARLLPGEDAALAVVPEAFARACVPVFAGRPA